jgi:hypothetical protein
MPKKDRLDVTPGQLYRGIIVERGIPKVEREKLFKKKMPRYVRFCKRIYKMMPTLSGRAKYSEEQQATIEFLNWDLRPEEFASAVNFTLIVSLAAAFIIWFALVSSPLSELLIGIIYGPYLLLALLVIVALSVTRFVYMYPFAAAEVEQKKAIGYIPEIVGYMIMSMKLTPNLEKAVEFAAEHGRGKIAEEFKKLLWDVEIGVYATIAEGLDTIAYRWGKYSPEFKRALMHIRSSVLEDTEAKRDTALNRTMDELLTTIKEKMQGFARELKQPSIVLFFVGVLLPLILMIILPMGSVFSGLPLANPFVLIAIYNVAIPIGTFYFARNIIKRRPPTQDVPEIPDNYAGLPPKGKIKFGKALVDVKLAIAIVALFGLLASYYFHAEGFPPRSIAGALSHGGEPIQLIKPDQTEEEVLRRSGYSPNYFSIPGGPLYQQYVTQYMEKTGDRKKAEESARVAVLFEKKRFFMQKENDVTPYNLWFGVILTLALCLFIALYYPNKYKRKVQEEIMEMESEFKDALYIIASRLGENKPMEEALRHTQEFLPRATITKRVFSKTLDNINLLGMPLESAVFDSKFGSVTMLPSETIRTGMRLVVDASRLGTSIAARTLASLSLQLDNTEKVAKALKELTADLIITMRTMAVIIAPIVLGITTALFKIVVLTMANISSSTLVAAGPETGLPAISKTSVTGMGKLGELAESFGRISAGTFLKPESLAYIAEPLHFIIITGIYVVEIVLIILYFATMLEEKNKLLLKLRIAKYLPLALAIYTITVMITNSLLGFLAMGG